LAGCKLWQSTDNLQPANSYNCTQLTPKIASVVPPEDGRLTPETYTGLRHNKVIVKVYWVGYVIVMYGYICDISINLSYVAILQFIVVEKTKERLNYSFRKTPQLVKELQKYDKNLERPMTLSTYKYIAV
jgi:hypothetical protein